MGGVKRKSLLEDEEEEEEEEDEGTIKVNEAYAKRFEHNKRREDLHRLQEFQKKGIAGSDDEDSTAEDEDEDGLLPARVDAQIFNTLAKIRKKDPAIYSQDAKFYDDETDGESGQESDEEVEKKKKKKKSMYLKDVIARQLLEGGAEAMEEEEEVPKPKRPLSYAEEQEELKRSFLRSVAEAGSDEDEAGGLFRVKEKTEEEADKDKRETEEAVAEAEQRAKDMDIARKLEEYFGQETDLDDSEKFLKSYLLNKGWIDQESRRVPFHGDVELSEDEEEVEKQDKFEAEYNFRFQEGAGSQILGHSRMVEGSVRKKADSRKKQRMSKREREIQQDRARQEEVKRLKNVKKKEIVERLEKIRSIAGADEEALAALGEDDLEEEFDPDDYDKKMAEAFGDGYYGAQDVDERFNDEDAEGIEALEKPDFDAEDDLLGLPKGWETEEKIGFAAVRDKLKKTASERDAPIGSDDGGAATGSVKGQKKMKISLKEKIAFDKKLEEFYKLDYEDMVGDLPTRFKYRKVKPNMYSLKTRDILTADDKELNQLVSLKKIAPYCTEEWQAPSNLRLRLSRKNRKKAALDMFPRFSSKQEKRKTGHEGKKVAAKKSAKTGDRNPALEGKSQPDLVAQAPEDTTPKKPSRKRRKQKGPQLSLSRLVAYGKVQPTASKKKM